MRRGREGSGGVPSLGPAAARRQRRLSGDVWCPAPGRGQASRRPYRRCSSGCARSLALARPRGRRPLGPRPAPPRPPRSSLAVPPAPASVGPCAGGAAGGSDGQPPTLRTSGPRPRAGTRPALTPPRRGGEPQLGDSPCPIVNLFPPVRRIQRTGPSFASKDLLSARNPSPRGVSARPSGPSPPPARDADPRSGPAHLGAPGHRRAPRAERLPPSTQSAGRPSPTPRVEAPSALNDCCVL